MRSSLRARLARWLGVPQLPPRPAFLVLVRSEQRKFWSIRWPPVSRSKEVRMVARYPVTAILPTVPADVGITAQLLSVWANGSLVDSRSLDTVTTQVDLGTFEPGTTVEASLSYLNDQGLTGPERRASATIPVPVVAPPQPEPFSLVVGEPIIDGEPTPEPEPDVEGDQPL
jgi:hypothetical protein